MSLPNPPSSYMTWPSIAFMFQNRVSSHGKKTWLLLLLEYCGPHSVCNISLLLHIHALVNSLFFFSWYAWTILGQWMSVPNRKLWPDKAWTKNYPCPTCIKLVRAECVRQHNEVAIKLGIISPLSLLFPSSAKSPRESCRRVPKFCMGS